MVRRVGALVVLAVLLVGVVKVGGSLFGADDTEAGASSGDGTGTGSADDTAATAPADTSTGSSVSSLAVVPSTTAAPRHPAGADGRRPRRGAHRR
jgi:hypothetical protein